jgi:hypothetical protein
MSLFRKFCSLTADDRHLLLAAFANTALFRLALVVFSIERLRGWAGRAGAGNRPAERIAWAVTIATRWMPSTCLSSSLALQKLLSTHGHRSELHIGVSRVAGDFAAHAWVESEGRVLFGEHERGDYARIVCWSAPIAAERATPHRAG